MLTKIPQPLFRENKSHHSPHAISFGLAKFCLLGPVPGVLYLQMPGVPHPVELLLAHLLTTVHQAECQAAILKHRLSCSFSSFTNSVTGRQCQWSHMPRQPLRTARNRMVWVFGVVFLVWVFFSFHSMMLPHHPTQRSNPTSFQELS